MRVVAKNTHTYERPQELGMNSITCVAELVRFISINMNVPPSMVENILCEYMREESESSFEAKDTVELGQGLFSVTNGILTWMDENGTVTGVSISSWRFGAIDYSDGLCWWETDFRLDGITGLLRLTVNAKQGNGEMPVESKKGKRAKDQKRGNKSKTDRKKQGTR